MNCFAQIIEKELKEGSFFRFDTFLMEYLGFLPENGTEKTEELRKLAYRSFLHRVDTDKPASLPTIRRWFGLFGYKEPSREQMFRIAISLKLSVEETGEFLMNGIGEPFFQINDYTEIIAMYCLENKLDFAEYERMLEEYETSMEAHLDISQASNTNWLFQQFEHVKCLSKEDFMYWMWEHAGSFKGYSRTVQEYLEKYRSLILDSMRRDMKKRLEFLLAETGYVSWREKGRLMAGAKEGERIQKYIKQCQKRGKGEISEHLANNILELAKFVYSETGQNTRLLAELFSPSEHMLAAAEERSEHVSGVVKAVSAKYLSDLFNIPLKNEVMIRARQAVRELEAKDGEESCPEYIQALIRTYSRGKVAVENAGEACGWLREFVSEEKRRRHIVKRNDLLPMILYVSQQIYTEAREEGKQPYDAKMAEKEFRKMADATMIACNMTPLDERYVLDKILLCCFQENEMYGYGDVMGLV